MRSIRRLSEGTYKPHTALRNLEISWPRTEGKKTKANVAVAAD